MPKSFLSFLLLLLLSAPVLAQTSEELRKQQADIQKEIDDLKKILSDTRKNKKASLGQLALVQKKLRLRERAISNINEQIDIIQRNISQSRNDIDKLKVELDTLKAQYEKSVVYAYKNRSNYDFLNFIFSATSFNDALKRVSYLKSYRAYREEQAANIAATQNLLQDKIAGLEVNRKRKDEVLQKQEKQKEVLISEKKEKDQFLSKLKARENEINKELAIKARADRKLKAGIAAAIKREAAREAKLAREREAAANKNNEAEGKSASAASASPRKSTSVFTATPEGEIISDNFEKNKGHLPWPVDRGTVKIHYGVYSVEGTTIKGNNPGLTMETDQGAPVKAVFDGEVITVFDVDGSSAIVIKHGKYFTSYGNLASVTVSKGQSVKAGQVIGRASSNADGNGEVEFLLLQESRNIDPEPWIQRK